MKTPVSSEVFLSLGSNVGDRCGHLMGAIEGMSHFLRQICRAAFYQTEALDGAGPEPFLNTVVCGETDLSPRQLLEAILQLETRLGRRRDAGRRYGPRAIDIDLLLYGERIIQDADLTVPHPRMARRAFVLIPLLELAPDIHDPISRRLFRDMLAELPNQGVYSYEASHYNGPPV